MIKEKRPYPAVVFRRGCREFLYFLYFRDRWVGDDRWQSTLELVSLPSQESRSMLHTPVWRVYDSKKRFILSPTVDVVWGSGGHIYYLWKKDYLLVKMDREGEVRYEKIATPREKEEEWLEGTSFKKGKFTFPSYIYPASWIVPLGKGLVVVRRKDYSRECRGFAEGGLF